MLAAWNLPVNENLAYDFSEILQLETLNAIFRMAARKRYVVPPNHARTAVFAAGFLLATMIARLVEALARLWACEDLVHALRVASSLTSVTAVWEASITSKLASALRAEFGKVIGLGGFHLYIHVSRAAKTKSLAN